MTRLCRRAILEYDDAGHYKYYKHARCGVATHGQAAVAHRLVEQVTQHCAQWSR